MISPSCGSPPQSPSCASRCDTTTPSTPLLRARGRPSLPLSTSRYLTEYRRSRSTHASRSIHCRCSTPSNVPQAPRDYYHEDCEHWCSRRCQAPIFGCPPHRIRRFIAQQRHQQLPADAATHAGELRSRLDARTPTIGTGRLFELRCSRALRRSHGRRSSVPGTSSERRNDAYETPPGVNTAPRPLA